jgi:hypothetical protein
MARAKESGVRSEEHLLNHFEVRDSERVDDEGDEGACGNVRWMEGIIEH